MKVIIDSFKVEFSEEERRNLRIMANYVYEMANEELRCVGKISSVFVRAGIDPFNKRILAGLANFCEELRDIL